VSGTTALWEGFSSFFSIWQVCILQISPFFIAYIVGLYLATLDQKPDAGLGQWVILPAIAYTAGFTIFYALLIASGLNISRSLLYNIGDLRVVSGIIILLVGLYILLVDRIHFLSRQHNPILLSILSLLIGVTFAIIYSPCITPTLSEIMNLAAQKASAVEGWYLAFFYGLGISAALVATSITLILFLRRRDFVMRHTRLIKNVCGIIVLVPALLNIAGLMRHYKAFFLGFLV